MSLSLGLQPQLGGRSLIQRAIASLRARGADAHLWLPGVGTLNGLQTGNYLESTGNTLATVDNPTGLVLDALGSVGVELVTNGDFSNGTTGWTADVGLSLSVVSGALRALSTVSGASARIARQTVSGLTVGATYRVTASVLGFGGAGAQAAVPSIQIRNAADTATTATITAPATTNCTISGYFVATDTSHRIRPRWDGDASTNTTSYLDFDNISVREVSGIHAQQGTTANKPLLRRGLVNLLTSSGDFTTVYWSLVAGATRSTVAGAGPDGSAAIRMQTAAIADGLRQYQTTVAAGYTGAVLIKSNNGSTQTLNLRYFNNTEPFVTPITVTAEWQVLVAPVTATAGGNFQFDIQSSVTTPVVDVLISRALLTPGTLTASQILAAGGIPVTTTAAASNPDAGRYSWSFDGSNDSLALSSVPFQMSDDHCVIAAGVNYASTGDRYLFDGGNTVSSNAMVCSLVINNTQPKVYWRDDAAVNKWASGVVGSIPIGSAAVLSARKLGTSGVLRLNGLQVGATATVTPGVTTCTHSVIGVRVVPGIYFNGNIGPVLAIKGTVSDAELLLYERLIAALTPNGPVF